MAVQGGMRTQCIMSVIIFSHLQTEPSGLSYSSQRCVISTLHHHKPNLLTHYADGDGGLNVFASAVVVEETEEHVRAKAGAGLLHVVLVQ